MSLPNEDEVFWRGVYHKGPLCLTETALERLERDLKGPAVIVLRVFVAQMKRDAEWIEQHLKALEAENVRIQRIGQTLKRAGLRSYTDEKGRIYVTEDK